MWRDSVRIADLSYEPPEANAAFHSSMRFSRRSVFRRENIAGARSVPDGRFAEGSLAGVALEDGRVDRSVAGAGVDSASVRV
ncbi:hypothetical protein GCM10028856_34290 [Halopiger thermotolerans]